MADTLRWNIVVRLRLATDATVLVHLGLAPHLEAVWGKIEGYEVPTSTSVVAFVIERIPNT